MIGVLSVNDHALLREGIAALVNADSDMKLIAEASNGQEGSKRSGCTGRISWCLP
jgi:DNA-binding NarL/FixJ family response regulator